MEEQNSRAIVGSQKLLGPAVEGVCGVLLEQQVEVASQLVCALHSGVCSSHSNKGLPIAWFCMLRAVL
jgi:hypothetical protein